VLDFSVVGAAATPVTAAHPENAQRAFDTLTLTCAAEFSDLREGIRGRSIGVLRADCSGVALWLSSGAGPDEDALTEFIEEGVTKQWKGGRLASL